LLPSSYWYVASAPSWVSLVDFVSLQNRVRCKPPHPARSRGRWLRNHSLRMGPDPETGWVLPALGLRRRARNGSKGKKASPKRGREQHVGNGGRLSFSLHEAIRPFFSFRKSIRNARRGRVTNLALTSVEIERRLLRAVALKPLLKLPQVGRPSNS
jgi:hypothetical protein